MRLLSYFLAITALLAPAVVQAQAAIRVQDGFNVPADVPLYVNPNQTYRTDGQPNQLGDGKGAAEPSTTWGGVMPVLANQLPDIPATAAGWFLATSSVSYFKTVALGASEAKFRSHANFADARYGSINFDDAIRNWGAPGTAHCHQYFGNIANAFSTYPSLRNRANQRSAAGQAASAFAGGPYNATAYWVPCVIKNNAFGDGKSHVVKIDSVTVYYLTGITESNTQIRLPRGHREIIGRNADDPLGGYILKEIQDANAASGTNRYSRTSVHGTLNDGFNGWECRTENNASVIVPDVAHQSPGNSSLADYFKSAAGEDPWGGRCTAGMKMKAHLVAPKCYDGTNLWSPGGYKHVNFGISDNVAGSTGCRDGEYKKPQLNITVSYTHQGFADYGTWVLSSDAMFQAKINALVAAGAPNYSAFTVPPGWSMHSDWLGAWDDKIFFGSADKTVKGWQLACLGVEGHAPAECNTSQFNATQSLAGASIPSPDNTRNPQVDISTNYDTLTADKMFVLPIQGPVTTRGGN